jgi:hypothetical protein
VAVFSLSVLLVAVLLVACGGPDESESTSDATRPEPATQRSTSPYSPDAGIAEGHAVADARARRCRAARPAYSRSWRRCGRLAR